MNMVSRLKKTAVVLAAAAGITSAYFHAWGDVEGVRKAAVSPEKPRTLVRLADDIGSGRFSQSPLLSYDSRGDNYFALQLQPILPAAPARPRDILVMVDTSASQAGFPLRVARRLAEALVNDTAPNDRIAIMTVNTPRATRDLTTGFQEPKAPAVQSALKALDEEYPAGANDLRNALEQGLKSFDNRASRQQVILFLGDCESAYNPLSEKDRLGLADKMVQSNVGFFAVPLGQPNPKNLHTLVTGTGGAVVRFQHGDAKQDNSDLTPVVKKINDLLAVPVLMPSEFKFAQAPADVFPAKLPPLRSDTPTLVVGRYDGKKPATVDLTIAGKIAGHAASVKVSEAMAPSASENYFLPNIVTQWKRSDNPSAPALLRADRTLAQAHEQTRLALDEMLTQANWAMGSNQYEVARHLFTAAHELKEDDGEAKAGLTVVEKLRSGMLTPQQFKQALKGGTLAGTEKGADGKVRANRLTLEEIAKREEVFARQDVAPPPAPGTAPPAVPAAPGTVPVPAPVPGDAGLVPAPRAVSNDDLLRIEQSRRNVLTQQIQTVVDETLARGRRLLADGDPASAEALLKQQRDAVRSNPDIADATRSRMLTSIESLIREVNTRGAEIVGRRQFEAERIAAAKARIAADDNRQAEDLRTRDRISAFATLMRQARFEEQYREAEAMRQEYLANAKTIPPETAANYMMGQAATNLREFRELVRIREDRFLLTMMQLEKTAIPYPDEPPVHFPPSKVWRELLELRHRFATESLSGNLPERQRNRMSFLQSALDTPLQLDQPFEATLIDVLSTIEDLASPQEAAKNPAKKVKILVDEKELGRAKGEMFDANRIQIKLPKLSGASLGTVLKIITSQMDASYFVRRDYIEITSTEAAIREKVTAAFQVADLVVPIPSAVSQQALQQGLQVLGATFSLGGGGTPIGGAFGVNGQIGLIGGVGFGGAGGGGGGQIGGNQALQNTFQGQSNVNLGAQGGLLGFGGGQLGQYGNLGGQFGFQGGTQHQILIELIQSVIARGEWVTAQSALITGNTNLNDPNAQGNDTAIVPVDQLNSMGFYPPALSLVVRATSRIHPSPSSRLTKGGAGMVMNDAPGRNGLAAADRENDAIGMIAEKLVKTIDGKEGVPMKVVKGLKDGSADLDAKKIWKEVIARMDPQNTDPRKSDVGAIVDTVGTLGVMGKFDHVVELLKENLRKGIAVEPWAHEALAQALRNSQGDDVELERAMTSGIDLNPGNAQAYLKASSAVAKNDPEQAVRFCAQAARLEPELADPYMNALVFAGDVKNKLNLDTLTWAAGNLLARDWAADSAEYHGKARVQLNDTIAKLIQSGRQDEATRIQKLLDGDKRRDLVVQLVWENGGERETAGLDLKVTEPTGTTCNVLNKTTSAGGVLVSDYYKKNDGGHVETYTASEAFSGDYTLSVDKVWGRSLGNKATIKVTRHQGTPDEMTQLYTIDLAKNEDVKINLRDGRRTKIAAVPAPNLASGGTAKPERQEQVMNKLRAITESTGGFEGGVATVRPVKFQPAKSAPASDISWTGRVDALISNGVEMQAKVVLGANGEQKMVLTPIFSATQGNAKPSIKIDIIPGGEG